MTYTLNQKVRAVRILSERGLNYIEQVVSIFKCSIRTVWNWWIKWNGTDESLARKKYKLTKQKKNQHTFQEHKVMKKLYKLYPNLSLMEFYGQLHMTINYTRSYSAFHSYFTKHIQKIKPKKLKSDYKPKLYNTPKLLGLKWQMDVKFVPKHCYPYSNENHKLYEEKIYQYTIIDEATRQRFIYSYNEHSGYSTCDFIEKAIKHFGYKPVLIQTDNGTEFVNLKWGQNKTDKPHAVELLLLELNIQFKQILPATPRHNGKVERSHRKDQQWYTTLSFDTFAELDEKMAQHLKLYNETPTRALPQNNNRWKWLSPLQKRSELLHQLTLLLVRDNILRQGETMSIQEAIYYYAKNYTNGEYIPLENKI